jgi:hypothetical protein
LSELVAAAMLAMATDELSSEGVDQHLPARDTKVVISSGEQQAPRRSAVRGGKLLMTDARVAFMVANEARYRALERLLGVRRDQANVMTLVAAVVAVETSQQMAARTRGAVKSHRQRSRSDALIGMATVREGMRAIAGPTAADEPLFGTLVMFAVLAKPTRRAALGAAHRVGASLHHAGAGFRHRYGYIVDPGRRRERRAERRAERRRAPRLPGSTN